MRVVPWHTEFWTVRDHEQDTSLAHLLDHHRQGGQGARIDPVRVLDHHQDRRARGDIKQLLDQRRLRELVTFLRRQQLCWVAVGRQREQRGEQGSRRRHAIGLELQHRLELVEPHRRAIVAVDARRALQLADDRVECRAAVVGRALVAQPHMGRLVDGLTQRLQQPALADARLAADKDDTPLAGAGLLPGAKQLCQFALAPDERRQVDAS